MGRPKKVQAEEVVVIDDPRDKDETLEQPVREQFDPSLPESKQRHLR
jgi:hypothetical protein